MSEPDVISNIPIVSQPITPQPLLPISKLTTMAVEKVDVVRMEKWRTNRKERVADIFKKVLNELEELQKKEPQQNA